MQILEYTDAHEALRCRLRDFIATKILPDIEKWEADHIVPHEAWRQMGQQGFLCTWASKEYGGLGGDFLYSVICAEEMAKTNQGGFLTMLHSDIIVPYIEAYGSLEQKKKYLPGCVSGDIVTAVAMTEPGAGSDLAAMTTTAAEQDDTIVLNGSKTFISNGINCRLVVVAAKDPAVEVAHKAIGLYLVEDGTPGFEKGKRLEKMGMHSQDTAELFFTNCHIPKQNRLGEPGRGFAMLMEKLQQERLIVAIWALARAEYVLDWTIDYCRRFPAAGPTLSKSQCVQFALAEMATEVRMSRWFVDGLVADHMQKSNVVVETSMAKYQTSDMVNRIADRCIDLIGPAGVDEACPLAREWRDVRAMSIFAGTNEIMKNIIAKSMQL